ncbi:lysoplasmalogenase [Streptomyces sp. NPDC046261]|uniref:lysoplasmalogenase n=1 Tax=Streptomyces sp. NPDC046261 TaxID=3157200 RepID=UPI0033D83962
MTGGRAAPLAFAAVAATHLAALLADAPVLAHVTKPALMPLLAVCVLARGGPRLLVLALLFGCGGDTLLQVGGEVLFLLGMASFAAGHACYLVLFARYGSPGGARTRRLAAAYATAWLGTLALLWPGLEPGLRVPVTLYSLLLTAMALGATRAHRWAGAGGALFLLSDTLIAGGLAAWPQAPAPQFWIMLTYVAAQSLLTHGVLTCGRREGHEGHEGGAGRRPPGPSTGHPPGQSWTAARASTMP